MIEFKLPSLGADMDRGRLLEWRIKPGDAVKRGDVVAVVDTSKAAIDVEIWQDGIVDALLLQPGDDVPVGTPMLTLLGAAVPITGAAEVRASSAPATAAAPPPPSPPRPFASSAAAAASDHRRRISPAARKRAEELGIALERVSGTGPDGAVTLEDVQRAAAPKLQAATLEERLSAMRQTIAAAMARSKREIPHYYLATQVPLERATEWMLRVNAERPVTARILLAALVIKAAALAARRYPEVNGFYRDGAFHPSPDVNVGIAISLRQGGLVAPGLLAADTKSVDEIMASLSDLVKRTRAFSLRASELSQPTLTLTNLGDQGVELVHGVIYPPQVALIGFGKPTRQAWVEGNALRLIPVATATLAADHRVSDGHRGALFLAHLRDLLQAPEKL